MGDPPDYLEAEQKDRLDQFEEKVNSEMADIKWMIKAFCVAFGLFGTMLVCAGVL